MSFGLMGVDWEERVNFERLRKYRLERAREALKKSGCGAFLCYDIDNMRYITAGHIGEWSRGKMVRYCLLPLEGDPILFDNGSAVIANRMACPWLGEKGVQPAIIWMRGAAPSNIPVDKHVDQIKSYLQEYRVADLPLGVDCILDMAVLPSFERAGIKLVDSMKPMLDARMIKNQDEVELIRASCSLVDAAYTEVQRHIRAGVFTGDLEGIIHNKLYQLGVEWVEWVNCLSGPYTNPNYHRYVDRIVRYGESIFFDIISRYNGYMTCYYRTFVIGKTSEDQNEIWRANVECMNRSAKELMPGKTTKDVAEKFYPAKYYGAKTEDAVFGNCLCHGLGMSIHEPPVASRNVSLVNPVPYKENMVVALEVWTGGRNFGVRIEDMYWIKSGGPERLTLFPRDEPVVCGL